MPSATPSPRLPRPSPGHEFGARAQASAWRGERTQDVARPPGGGRHSGRQWWRSPCPAGGAVHSCGVDTANRGRTQGDLPRAGLWRPGGPGRVPGGGPSTAGGASTGRGTGERRSWPSAAPGRHPPFSPFPASLAWQTGHKDPPSLWTQSQFSCHGNLLADRAWVAIATCLKPKSICGEGFQQRSGVTGTICSGAVWRGARPVPSQGAPWGGQGLRGTQPGPGDGRGGRPRAGVSASLAQRGARSRLCFLIGLS